MIKCEVCEHEFIKNEEFLTLKIWEQIRNEGYFFDYTIEEYHVHFCGKPHMIEWMNNF